MTSEKPVVEEVARSKRERFAEELAPLETRASNILARIQKARKDFLDPSNTNPLAAIVQAELAVDGLADALTKLIDRSQRSDSGL